MLKKFFLILGVLAAALQAQAYVYYTDDDTKRESNDTVMVYNSWNAIFEGVADTVLINPEFVIRSPYDFEFQSNVKGDKVTKKMLKEKTVAVAVGDTLWLINTDYLKHHFKGDTKPLKRYAPMYFSGKIVFVQHLVTSLSFGQQVLAGLAGGLVGLGLFEEVEDVTRPAPFYMLDFGGKMVYKVDSELLHELLEDYPDLQRRYEQMRDWRETYMINEFFLDYVNRLDDDPSYPWLENLDEAVAIPKK